jgi:CheY-like chemotaxis protein
MRGDDGWAALAALEKGSFDLILINVQMPELDGLEATAAIRAKEKLSGGHIPIVAMTAHALVGDQERCLAAGMDGYLSKPIRTDELFAKIEDLLGGRGGTKSADVDSPHRRNLSAHLRCRVHSATAASPMRKLVPTRKRVRASKAKRTERLCACCYPRKWLSAPQAPLGVMS